MCQFETVIVAGRHRDYLYRRDFIFGNEPTQDSDDSVFRRSLAVTTIIKDTGTRISPNRADLVYSNFHDRFSICLIGVNAVGGSCWHEAFHARLCPPSVIKLDFKVVVKKFHGV